MKDVPLTVQIYALLILWTAGDPFHLCSTLDNFCRGSHALLLLSEGDHACLWDLLKHSVWCGCCFIDVAKIMFLEDSRNMLR